MSIQELYSEGARVWIADDEVVWREASLLQSFADQKQLSVQLDDGAHHLVPIKSRQELPPLKNPEILIGENDLTSLSYLHEPAVLHNLRVRFCERGDIYTYCGIVLVAINPYQSLPIYDVDTIQAYSGQDMSAMDPHIFAVAEEAYKNMSSFNQNQSLIVSGESGAGKTVSAKYAMRYFATVGGAQGETQIEKRVLASNPIMEAIGNAKTTRNDNSSRFGKFIELGFTKSNKLQGAHMRTYLLEKSRVVFQATEERNYHIFYQLCASSEMPEFEHFKLNDPGFFYYTNQGQSPLIDSVDDGEEMMNTREALTLLGIGTHQQMDIFRILSAVLHLGNVTFEENDREASFVNNGDIHHPIMCELFGVNAKQLRNWLCNRKITTAQEVLTTPLTATQACNARDALAKHIYSRLFNHIVSLVNKSLSTSTKKVKFIGVLDIYGFETFEINSFEQFCINYANEKLQQQFCLHVFKLEQEEYVREEIEWSMIDFYDNQPCIDLIESKFGILSLLDEECRLPSGADHNWCQRLYDKHSQHHHFSKPRMSRTAFIVHHFADNVEYESYGFLEKNRDTVLEEQVNILKASQYELVAELFKDGKTAVVPQASKRPPGGILRAAKEPPRSTPSKQHRQTVGSQFRESLDALMMTLFATTPHYVRCIKPNDLKLPFTFEPKRAVQQLRACGVLETIRISAAGYPSRWTYLEFFQRYRVLSRSSMVIKNNVRKSCENILNNLIKDPDKYQFGKTKIFFRAGQVAYLEKLRSERLRACCVLIQKRVRGWLARGKFLKIRRSVLLVQTAGRGLLARQHAHRLRQTKAATILQSVFRGFRDRTYYEKTKMAVIVIQTAMRGLVGRRQFNSMRCERQAIRIQSAMRGCVERKKYKKVLRGIILLQAHVRRRQARKQLKELKIEARSVEHIKSVAKGLENKIIELQQKLDVKSDEVVNLREDQQRLATIKEDYQKLKQGQSKRHADEERLTGLEALVTELQEQLKKERQEKQLMKDSLSGVIQEKETIINSLNGKYEGLLDQKDQLLEENKLLNEQKQTLASLQQTDSSLLDEMERERLHHQKLIKEHERLQQRLENLQTDLMLPGKKHRRSLSNISNISEDSLGSAATEKSENTNKDEEAEEDLGYGSERRREKKASIAVVDSKEVGLMTRLQSRIKDLEREKSWLNRELERKEDLQERPLGGRNTEREIMEAIKLQELEMENSKLKEELGRLRQAVASSADLESSGSSSGEELVQQIDALNAELERRREECLQLRTLLTTKTRGMAELADESYGGDLSLLNEDGELEMAYHTQKDLNKLLETELNHASQRQKELQIQISRLTHENLRKQELLSENLNETEVVKMEKTLQHEISRLTSENLDLLDESNQNTEKLKKLRKALKIYAKRLKMAESSDVAAELEREIEGDTSMPLIKHHQGREFAGMLEYRREDEPLLMRNLILDLQPMLTKQQLPGLPAYLLFMCIRHTDHINDDEKVRSLLTNSIGAIRKVLKKRPDDLETNVLWLSNTIRLLHTLKQYSGEAAFRQGNSSKQNEHCLRNFDLSEYRQVLSDLAVWIYQGLIKVASGQLHAMIVGAILEHEAIAGLSAPKVSGLRGRNDRKGEYTLTSLVKSLTSLMRVFNEHALDPQIVQQIFRQLFYIICANALNNLLLRKDMCHWTKGMQIRYNISHLEQWLRDQKIYDSHVQEGLEPIIQASQVLQARKTDKDAQSMCDMCTKLSTAQIIKILNLYTPVNEFEERVPMSFIHLIQEKLASRQENSQTLLMDTKFTYAVTFPFNPSSVGLESLSIPNEWGLPFLKRL